MLSSDGVELQAFNLRDVLGKNIKCQDGVVRRVETISYSQRYADKVLVNEVNEDETPGGAWVHVLSLSCQMFGNPIPTPEQMKAFSRMASALRWQPEKRKDGLVQLPSGLLIGG